MLKKIFPIFLLVAFSSFAVFAQAQKPQPYRYSDGDNVLRLAPITVMDLGVGFGISYERLFGSDKKFGLILPVYLILENKNDDNKGIERITKRYRVDLRYAYRVGQRDYVGTNVLGDWTPIYGVREQAEKITVAWPAGKSVAVHYDPTQPGTATLEPGNRQGTFGPLVFGAIFAAGGALLLVFFVAVGFGD